MADPIPTRDPRGLTASAATTAGSGAIVATLLMAVRPETSADQAIALSTLVAMIANALGGVARDALHRDPDSNFGIQICAKLF